MASTDGSELDAAGNCFAGNTGATTAPADLERHLPCGGSTPATIAGDALTLAAAPKGIEFTLVPLPGPQPQMPGAGSRRWQAPPRTRPPLDLTKVRVPRP